MNPKFGQGGEGLQNPENFADVLYVWSLTWSSTTYHLFVFHFFREPCATGVHARAGDPDRGSAHPLPHRARHHPRPPDQVQVKCGCEQEEVGILPNNLKNNHYDTRNANKFISSKGPQNNV